MGLEKLKNFGRAGSRAIEVPGELILAIGEEIEASYPVPDPEFHEVQHNTKGVHFTLNDLGVETLVDFEEEAERYERLANEVFN